MVCHSVHHKKEERRTKHAPRTPTTGPTERYLADAPFRERGSSTASVDQEPEGSGWLFSGKQKPDAHASVRIVFIAVFIHDFSHVHSKDLLVDGIYLYEAILASRLLRCRYRRSRLR
jgi:hypothetical protein